MRAVLLAGLISIVLTACSLHTVDDYSETPLPFPDSFQSELNGDQKQNALWWKSFEDPELNELINKGFEENLPLNQAWQRLKQARELVISEGAALYPQIGTAAQGERTEIQGDFFIPIQQKVYSHSYNLSYELDLWAKIYSRRKAADLQADAVRQDAEQTALLLASRIAEVWFSLVEQNKLTKILQDQIETSSTFLKLTELRFSLGQGSALEVLQQRQQLEAVRAELPLVEARLEQSWNELAVLLGTFPTEVKASWKPDAFPDLPDLEASAAPVDLLQSRPDLQAARMRVEAEDYRIAAALAERLPSLSFSLGYTFSALAWADLFNQELARIVGGATLPLIDGGQRRAVVRSQEARLAETLAAYKQSCLVAVQEVEDALVEEQAQQKLLKNLNKQVDIAKKLVKESRHRYMNGLSNYLDVILAIQSLQRLERQFVSTRRSLLAARVRLHRSLGGSWTDSLHEKGLEQEVTT